MRRALPSRRRPALRRRRPPRKARRRPAGPRPPHLPRAGTPAAPPRRRPPCGAAPGRACRRVHGRAAVAAGRGPLGVSRGGFCRLPGSSMRSRARTAPGACPASRMWYASSSVGFRRCRWMRPRGGAGPRPTGAPPARASRELGVLAVAQEQPAVALAPSPGPGPPHPQHAREPDRAPLLRRRDHDRAGWGCCARWPRSARPLDGVALRTENVEQFALPGCWAAPCL